MLNGCIFEIKCYKKMTATLLKNSEVMGEIISDYGLICLTSLEVNLKK